jgi:ABC-type antimicrobial peptide transport system permease subunit
MRIPLRAGREFSDRDLNQPVVVINETMAEHVWPGRSPVGLKFITGPWGPNPTWSLIIGVVGDVKQFGLDSDPSLDIYFPDLLPLSVILRANGNPQSLIRAMRAAIQSVDPTLPVSEIRTMEQIFEESSKSRRWTVALLMSFAVLALTLALVGICGLITYSVQQRVPEIGLRMALGSPPRGVRNMIILQGMRLALIGVGIGVAVALIFARMLDSFVFGVTPRDPLTFVAVPIALTSVALLACLLPANRATRINPSEALRWE